MAICATIPFCKNIKYTARSEPLNPENEYVYLTTVMYHNILNSRTGTYIISEQQLNDDLSCYKKHGYNFVLPSEVIAYAEKKAALPEKPIIITFDDGHYNNLYYGLPILLKHDAKACFCIVGKFSENSSTNGDDSNPNYSHLTWAQIGVLSKSGIIEIASHTYDMHNYKPRFGIGKIQGETDEEYAQALKNDIAKINEKLYGATGKLPVTFAYPFGKYTDTAKNELLNAGYKLMMTCNEGVTKITCGNTESLHYVRRYNRSGTYSTAEFVSKLEKGLTKAAKIDTETNR